jgi:hypothetical protein
MLKKHPQHLAPWIDGWWEGQIAALIHIENAEMAHSLGLKCSTNYALTNAKILLREILAAQRSRRPFGGNGGLSDERQAP